MPAGVLASYAAQCKSDLSGASEKFCLHGMGVSWATREAGCWPTRCSTSTR